VYSFSLILCRPPPAARSGRHWDFDHARPGKKRDHRAPRPNTSQLSLHGEKARGTIYTHPTHPFQNTLRPISAVPALPWPHLPGGRATVPGHSEPSGRPSKGPPRDQNSPVVVTKTYTISAAIILLSPSNFRRPCFTILLSTTTISPFSNPTTTVCFSVNSSTSSITSAGIS
jgi:hypothetical protein